MGEPFVEAGAQELKTSVRASGFVRHPEPTASRKWPEMRKEMEQKLVEPWPTWFNTGDQDEDGWFDILPRIEVHE
jgi:hypothetical protein